MTLELGALRYVHYEVETALGAGIVGAGTAIPIQSLDLGLNFEKDRPSWFIGSAKRHFEIPRRFWVEGSISVPAYPDITQDLIELGYDRTSVATGFDMDHSWAILESSLNEVRQFKGLLSNRMSISASSDDSAVMVDHDLLGITEVADAPFVRGALPPGQPFLFQCGTTTWFGGDISNRIMSFEITIENNLQLNDGPVECTGQPYYTIGGFRTVSATLNILYNDTANRLALRNQTEGSAIIVLTNASVTPNQVVTITIPRFTLDAVGEDKDPESATEETISIEPITDASDDDITIAFSTIP